MLSSSGVSSVTSGVAKASTTTKRSQKSSDLMADLSESEKTLYGNRSPDGFEKIQLLGKGGCAIVWLAKNQETGQKVALK
jgi:serine/threonine protein kinase